MQNSVATCSAHPDLLLTASADETVRLTNMRTGARIAACFGDVAHLAEVLCVAWHPTKTWLAASAGLDDAVAVWDLQPVRNEHFSLHICIRDVNGCPVLALVCVRAVALTVHDDEVRFDVRC